MDNSILISRYIQKILEEGDEIKQILGSDEHKIFPLLQPESLQFPYIVHQRISHNVTYTKDITFGPSGWINEIIYAVSCVSDNYIQSLELANAVRHTMETYRWKTNDMYIHPIQVYNISEYMPDNNTFVQEIQFKISVE